MKYIHLLIGLIFLNISILQAQNKVVHKPEKEFIDGKVKKFQTDGTGESQGVNFSFSYPESWYEEASDYPNLVRKFFSKDSDVALNANILVKDHGYTDKEKEDLLKGTNYKSLVPSDGEFVSGKNLTIHNLQGTNFIYRFTYDTEGQESLQIQMSEYILFYKEKMIILTFSIGDLNKSKVEKYFDQYNPLFALMADSFELK